MEGFGLGASANFNTSFTDILGGLFGNDSSQTQTQNTSGTSKTSETYKLSQEALDKIIQDVLGGTQGLAAIFSEENAAGIYDSPTAKLAAGNLVAQIIGEVAKLQSEKLTSTVTTGTTSATARNESEGILDKVTKAAGGLDFMGGAKKLNKITGF